LKNEVRNVDGERWEYISEKNFIETLAGIFDKVTPSRINILNGKEILTPIWYTCTALFFEVLFLSRSAPLLIRSTAGAGQK